MHLLREVVHRTTIQRDYATAFSSLLSKLKELNVQIETENSATGEIVTRCLTRVVDGLLWRCWSDKLIFEVKGIDADNTRLKVYAIPNLFRFKVAQNEKPMDLTQFLSQL